MRTHVSLYNGLSPSLLLAIAEILQNETYFTWYYWRDDGTVALLKCDKTYLEEYGRFCRVELKGTRTRLVKELPR